MTPTRQALLKCFDPLTPFPTDKPLDFHNLSEWRKKNSCSKVWVAGTLGRFEKNKTVLFDHKEELHLEHYRDNHPVYSGCWDNDLFQARDLRDGDKVAVFIDGDQPYKFYLLSVNSLSPENSFLSFRQTWKKQQDWHQFLSLVQSFFIKKGFFQASTPSLVRCPGLEPTIDPFRVTFSFGSNKKTLFLPTSPELHLKKIICQGVSSLFEIKTCYRNGEVGFQHQPEFTMLEWYRAFKTLNHLKEDIIDLISYVSQGLADQNEPIIEQTSVAALFKFYLSFDLSPKTNKSALLALAQSLGLNTNESDSWDDVFFLIFIDEIEPHLGQDKVTFVNDYPPSQAALARINSKGWADRFEMYWQGYEIANAFNELICPNQQISRFKSEQVQRESLKKEYIPIDQGFVKALRQGLPPTAGIAMGLERLFMAIHKINDINKLKHFPFEH